MADLKQLARPFHTPVEVVLLVLGWIELAASMVVFVFHLGILSIILGLAATLAAGVGVFVRQVRMRAASNEWPQPGLRSDLGLWFLAQVVGAAALLVASLVFFLIYQNGRAALFAIWGLTMALFASRSARSGG